MHHYHPYTIFPLGDRALTIDFGNEIDTDLNTKVLQLYQQLRTMQLPFVIDLIPAYSSLTIYYDVLFLRQHFPEQTAFDSIAVFLENLPATQKPSAAIGKLVRVPVCYEISYGWDLAELSDANHLTIDEVIAIHTSITYRVFMIGFLPGFAYMGTVDDRIATPRRSAPRKAIEAGAVGIAGKQTGIYPVAAPGGWQIIGRTPLSIFDKHKVHPVLFSPGDEVQFYPISEYEFTHY